MKRRDRFRHRDPRSRRVKRRGPATPRAVLWRHLKNRRLGGFKFRRDHDLGGITFDFYCSETRLGIEVVGPRRPSVLPMEERIGFLLEHGLIWCEVDEDRWRLQPRQVCDEILALCRWRKRLGRRSEDAGGDPWIEDVTVEVTFGT